MVGAQSKARTLSPETGFIELLLLLGLDIKSIFLVKFCERLVVLCCGSSHCGLFQYYTKIMFFALLQSTTVSCLNITTKKFHHAVVGTV